MSISGCSRRWGTNRRRAVNNGSPHFLARETLPRNALCVRARLQIWMRGSRARSRRRRNKSLRATSPRMNGYPDELGGRWRSGTVLKRDVFSTIERGRFRGDNGEVDAVLRRIDGVPWWSRVLARELFRRERRALAVAGQLGIAPQLLFAGRNALVRGWIDGVPLHIGKPHGDAG